MSAESRSQDFEKTLGYGIAAGLVFGIVFGIWTKDLLGALAIGTGVGVLLSYIWYN